MTSSGIGRSLTLAILFLLAHTAVTGAPDQTSVILITIDTLRADHLEIYGYEKGSTPATTALARDSVLFENVLVQTPLTLPSHTSILTGTYPFYHGVQENLAYLRKDVPTLAEWFKKRGYRTAAILGSVVLLAEWGLDRGFDVYDDNFPFPQLPDSALAATLEKPIVTNQLVSLSERPAERVVTLALRWLEANSDQPFFLWIHFFDPHDPYNPPGPFKRDFENRLYDGEIAYLESQLARLWQRLEELELYDSSLIVYTADHGESLGEHKEMFHAYYVYDSSLRVPLMFKLPSALAKGRIEIGSRHKAQVRSIDVAPTIIQLLGERVPEYMQGEGLVGIMTGRQPDPLLPAYAETLYPRYFGASPLFSYSTATHKYIDAPIPELYDLRADPSELSNIFKDNSVLANQLKVSLYELQRRFSPRVPQSEGEPASIDPAAVERLQALGYVAFSAGGGGGAGYSDLPDPKSRIDTHSEVIRALEVGRSGDTDKAIDILKKVSIREPETPFVHFTLASEYFRARLFLLAAEHFRKAVELQPESDAGAHFNLARSLYHAGLSSRAETVTKELLTKDPKHFSARHLLARLLAKRGDYQQAVEEELAVLQIRPYYLPALNNLGSYLLEMGQIGQAIEFFGRGLEVDPNLILLRRNLALAHLANTDYRKAAAEAKIIAGMLPESMLGHYYLGQAYTAMGELEEAKRSFDRARELDPRLVIPSLP